MMPVNEYARRYLEDLLSFFGINIRVEDKLVDDSTVELNVPSTRLNGFLIGQHGRNLQSLQHLTNMAVWRQGYEGIHAVVDVANYKAQQKQRIEKRAREVTAQVLSSGSDYEFEPMNAAQRRVIHQVASDTVGVNSSSVGEGQDRRVVMSKSANEEVGPTVSKETPAKE